MGNFCGTRLAAVGKARGLCKMCEDNYKQFTKSGKREAEDPLLRAVERSHVYCVKALIQAGADVNNSANITALVQAVSDGDDECVKVLLQAGADVNYADNSGNTALIQAAKKGNDECLKLLVNVGADVNKYNSDGFTALIEAVQRGQTKCVHTLIQAGANVNLKSESGDTPLIMATDLSNAYEILKLLAAAGADVNVPDSDSNEVLLSWLGLVDNMAIRQQVHLPLGAGAKIIVDNIRYRNAIHQYVHSWHMWLHPPDRTMVLSLYVAGESISLKHTCRETVRKYLLKLDNNENLFVRIPRLALPDSLCAYLLYNISI